MRKTRLKTAASLMVLLAALCWAAAAPAQAQTLENNEAYRQAAGSFALLQNSSDASPEEWRRLAGKFRAIYLRAPASSRGADSLYSEALSHREAWKTERHWKDLSRAVSIFRAFTGYYSRHPLADDALMHLAELQAAGYNDPSGALATYRRLLGEYPAGNQAPSARKQLRATTQILTAQRRAARSPADGSKPAGRKPRTAPGDSNPSRKFAAGKQGGKEKSAPRPAAAVQPEPSPRPDPLQRPQPSVLSAGASRAAPTPEPERGKNEHPTMVSIDRPGNARLRRIQFWSTLSWTRVILTTDAQVNFQSRRLPRASGQPERLFFDLAGTLPSDKLDSAIPVGDSILRRIRIGRLDRTTTRVVLDLKGEPRHEIKNFLLPGMRKIVIDLRRAPTPGGTLAGGMGPPNPGPLRKSGSGRAPALTLKSAVGLKVRSIMLDPGHGGNDPGATGYGLQEKKVVLALSHRLRRLFTERAPDLRIGMTRESDRYLALNKRPLLAKKFGADLFVSIHVNANSIERFHGVETYFLNLTRNASSLSLAARENATTSQQISNLNDILGDLLQDTNIVESSHLARTVQSALVGFLKPRTAIRDLGVKQAPFLVLMGAEMPSVLVEAGFITNRRENQRLRSGSYLDKLAEGIYAGLEKYIKQQNLLAEAPPGVSISKGRNL